MNDVAIDSSSRLSIWVLRHAKAAAQGPKGDVSRPLTGRGRRQAKSVRDHLQALGDQDAADLPSLVLCSPAVRARETAGLVMPAMPQARVQFEKDLYDEDAAGVVEWIRQLDPDESRLMVVGHNPTLLDLCVLLAAPAYREELESSGLPTAGLVRLDMTVADGTSGQHRWGGLVPGAARVAHRFVPES
jgi:phosphohistidine phosphatase